MRFHQIGTTREIVVTDLPPTVEGITTPPQFAIAITYTGDTGVGGATILDHCVIPAILTAINDRADLVARGEKRPYFRVGYTLMSDIDGKLIMRGQLLFRARDEAQARNRAPSLALDESDDDVRLHPYVVIDYVEVAETGDEEAEDEDGVHEETDKERPKPAAQPATAYTIFELDDEGNVGGRTLYFCREGCRSGFKTQNPFPFDRSVEGTANDYGAGAQCDWCKNLLSAAPGSG